MSLGDVKALTFDTGGTILDWHTGFGAALAKAGAKHGLARVLATSKSGTLLLRRDQGEMAALLDSRSRRL
jgi:FMN phosphatase YigB (HAD superfamily)